MLGFFIIPKKTKFRQSQSWDISWASSTFPTGIGTQNGETIPVTEGNYYIYFNKNSGQYIFSTTALATNEIDNRLNDISFYPNPAKDKIVFTQEPKSVEIYSTDGKKVNVSSNGKELNVSSLPKGIYLLHFITKDGSVIGKKLIKE